MKQNVCKECGRPKLIGKRNKDGELPFQINLEINNKDMEGIKKGHRLIWIVQGKKKIGYCEVNLEKAHKKT